MTKKNETNTTFKLFPHVMQTYHKNPYPNVVKNILLYGTCNNAVANQYNEAT